jgi:hypothetical protein
MAMPMAAKAGRMAEYESDVDEAGEVIEPTIPFEQ